MTVDLMFACVVDSPHTDGLPVQRRPPHTLLLPDDAAGGHRHRVLAQVQRVSRKCWTAHYFFTLFSKF